MTEHYDITRAYHRNDELRVDLLSFLQYMTGKRDTLDFVVNNHLVTMKPVVANYKRYVCVAYSPEALDYLTWMV